MPYCAECAVHILQSIEVAYMYVSFLLRSNCRMPFVCSCSCTNVCVCAQIFALIRDQENPQQFHVEFVKGAVRTFTSTDR